MKLINKVIIMKKSVISFIAAMSIASCGYSSSMNASEECYLNISPQGKIQGYSIEPNDPIIGRWVGIGWGNFIDDANQMHAVTGINHMTVFEKGRYLGQGYGRANQNPLDSDPDYWGTVYKITEHMYAAWNDEGLERGSWYLVLLSPDKNIAFVKDVHPNVSESRGAHEGNWMMRMNSDASFDLLLEMLNEVNLQ